MRFQNKICLVTGAASGIGKATALQLAREGAKIAVVDIDPEGSRTVQEICDTDGCAIFVQSDVADSAQVQTAVQATVARWGRIDVLVNDAAVMTFTPVLDLPDEDWDRVLAVNLRSIFLLCKYSVPHMDPGSAIVNVSSVHAHQTTKGVASYATSKGGMEAFTRAFSEELSERKVRINCVAPGPVDTPMLRNNPNIKNGVETISGDIGQPGELAAAICFLASEEASFIRGTTLVVDGGKLASLS